MRLKEKQEIVGTLHEIKEEDKCCKLQFSFIREIELPQGAISPKKLLSMVGIRIGIFCCDGQYFVRKIPGK